ncbi:hypothetical protein A2833_02715 [Candidatus Azambacteria bacterium RIFCSPHIGHO2_01_FULL_44_55]|uniref:Uncharacterized protein n=1 Tax=Candidatus Azambacteria bacterium RIFCSPLOWO2_02_FULL_44_14 TaxID=1797306 RepID=A0A1F5CA95_9BACT|nr:MAG: hypothetical protein A3A18_01650 [Candidatus Azambacteria bacterium RIFCSPLOWO2_01_FULL_44_84]OGD32812.1 MAG: hypothetical protein A3C78_03365 [Candidatus Azambacteria bacterium RIFCSPHIGHO2_02_FULL_45_18]OGD39778.1 MAG: hypothetical protein A3I30_02130 [Candidatus Azambacteria bacterium RIFCSPLOWO2_02_FULL_44_14]OGD40471.1 MAG: hypothetical protein A2833_02715 [Candidatus Azambacteria bacterium RIFCSPHIGHO2_01_FULL_44_55]
MYNTELAEKITKETVGFVVNSLYAYITANSRKRLTNSIREIVLKNLNAHYQTQSVTVNLEPTDGHGLDFPAS